MSHSKNTALQCLLAAVACVLAAGSSIAQDRFPSRPITIIVPFSAGGPPDMYTRLLSTKLSERLGWSTVIENKVGANSVLGTAYVVKAKPDGYTVLYGTNSGIAAAPGMVKDLSYNPVRDLAGVTIFSENHFVLITSPEEQKTSFAQFLEKVRANPEKYSIGGSAATNEILFKLMQSGGKLKNTYVPYANASNMMSDLLGGRLGGVIFSIAGSMSLIESKKVHAMAVTSQESLPILPGVPAMAATLPGVSLPSWSGFFVPAKTPAPVIDILYKGMLVVLKEPESLKRNFETGRPLFMSPEETNAFVSKEVPRWTALLRMVGVKPE